MALQERTVIVEATIRPNGNIDVRESREVYDDSITPVAADPDNGIVGVSDVVAATNHRYVILSDDQTPSDVQDFIDNSKA